MPLSTSLRQLDRLSTLSMASSPQLRRMQWMTNASAQPSEHMAAVGRDAVGLLNPACESTTPGDDDGLEMDGPAAPAEGIVTVGAWMLPRVGTTPVPPIPIPIPIPPTPPIVSARVGRAAVGLAIAEPQSTASIASVLKQLEVQPALRRGPVPLSISLRQLDRLSALSMASSPHQRRMQRVTNSSEQLSKQRVGPSGLCQCHEFPW